jgi:hypothetical protein
MEMIQNPSIPTARLMHQDLSGQMSLIPNFVHIQNKKNKIFTFPRLEGV